MFTTTTKLTKNLKEIVANITVKSGILSLKCNLVEKDGKFYLNTPSRFVESLKSETNSGHISLGSIDKEFLTEVKNLAVKQYQELKEKK